MDMSQTPLPLKEIEVKGITSAIKTLSLPRGGDPDKQEGASHHLGSTGTEALRGGNLVTLNRTQAPVVLHSASHKWG